MRTLTAILLLALFLFNLAGYRFVFNYLKDRNDKQFELLIDKEQYQQSSLFTIAVDLNLPYLGEQTSFERVSGEVTYHGRVYKYVKRRIVNGQMILLCIADAAKTKLQTEEQSKNARENNAANTVVKILVADYDFETIKTSDSSPSIVMEKKTLSNECVPTSQWVKSTIHPPDASMFC